MIRLLERLKLGMYNLNAFRKFMLSYLTFLIIIILFSSAFYIFSYRMLYDFYIEIINSDFASSAQLFESMLDELNRTNALLSQEEKIVSFSNLEELENIDYYTVKEALEIKSNYTNLNDLVDFSVIYFGKSGFTLLSSSPLPSGESWTNTFTINDEVYEMFFKNLYEEASQNRLIYGEYSSIVSEEDVTWYVTTNKMKNMLFAYALDNSVIEDIFIATPKEFIMNMTIEDLEGTLIYNKSYETEVDSFKAKGIIVSYTSSKNFVYTLTVANAYLRSKMHTLLGITVCLIITLIVVGILLSLYFAKKNTSPIYDILKDLSIKSNNANEYELILEAVKNIQLENDNLVENIYDNKILLTKLLSTDNNSISYSLEDERRLINTISSGKVEEVKEIIDSIFENNFNNKIYDEVENRFILIRLASSFRLTIARIIKKNANISLDINANVFDYSSQDNLKNNLNYIAECICNDVLSSKQDKFSQINEDIIRYLHENFHNPDLNLAFVAEEFNLTYSYISKIFKDKNNETFSRYLEKIRMRKAMELIENTEESFIEIAIKCGYLNINSFYKAFKRIYGVAPGNVRKMDK